MAIATPKITLYLGSTVDVTAYVQSVSIRRGRSRSIAHCTAGTAQIVLRNDDRRFDPEYADGAYYGNINLKMAVAVYGTVSASDKQVFEGTVDSWTINYDGPNASTVTVGCTDDLPLLSMISLESLTDGSGNKPPTFSEEKSGTRVTNILDCYVAAADGGGGSGSPIWPTGSDYRTIATGESTLQAKETKTNAWQELQVVANSELAQGTFVSREGKFVFKDRLTDIDPPVVIFSDDGSNIPYKMVSLFTDSELLFNLISLARHDTLDVLGGVPETASDSTSQSSFGKREYSRTGLLNRTNAAGTTEVSNMADFLLEAYKDQKPRFDRLQLDLNVYDAADQTTILELDVSTAIRVERTPRVDGVAASQILADMVVDNISHRMSPGNQWQITLGLSPYTELLGDFLIIDTGEIDSGKIGF